MSLTLVILAAGLATRYGRAKQLEPVGPAGEALLDYAIFDARRVGFSRVVLVVRRENEQALRSHVALRWRDLPVATVMQDLTDIPPGVAVPAGRTKPWGTAHAVLGAARVVNRPFAVANADDFYGRAAYAALAQHLRAGTPDQALVAFRLAETLSEHGGVSRGICDVGPDGYLRQVTEVHELRRAQGAVRGRGADGGERIFPADAVTSMNLWGFTPGIVQPLARGFAAFLAEHGADPRAEYPISTAAGALAAEGAIRLRVLPGGEQWMGMTHPADRAVVMARLEALIAAGSYPRSLAAAPPTRDG